MQKLSEDQNCVLLIIILYGRLYSPLELLITFVDRFKVTSVQFFIPGFNLLSWQLDNLRLKCYIESFYNNIILRSQETLATIII